MTNGRFLILCLAVALSFGACSGSNTSNDGAGPGNSQEPPLDLPKNPNGPGGNTPPEFKPVKYMPSDDAAFAVSENIQAYHLPGGLIADIMTETPNDHNLLSYSDVGDAALWTGLYLGAEAFRFYVTGDPKALAAVKRPLAAIKMMTDLPGTGYLARAFMAESNPHFQHFKDVEGGYGLYPVKVGNETIWWQAGVTRDQYGGVMFGLSVAYDFVPDAEVRATAKDLITRLTDYLLRAGWTTVSPNGKISTTFLQRPEQQLSILQVARHVNPERFKGAYEALRAKMAKNVKLPIMYESGNTHTSYYKFNLNHLYLYNLVRYGDDTEAFAFYKEAFKFQRDVLAKHNNPHFSTIEYALWGPNESRDAAIRQMLAERLAIGFRYRSIDLRKEVKLCSGEIACEPLPVSKRLLDGFMWQRSPMEVYYEADNRLESAGVDYILPYWMGRALGVYR